MRSYGIRDASAQSYEMNTLFEPSTAAALTTRIDHLRPDSARQWGRMSVGGMVCHLSDAFRMAGGDRETRDRGNLVTRTIIRFVAFWTPLRWPHGVKTLPEADQESDGTPPGGPSRRTSLSSRI